MTEKRIKIPTELLLEEAVKKTCGQLASLEGVTKTILSTLGITNWKYIKSKGGWQYLGSYADRNTKTNTYAVIPDATKEVEEGSRIETKMDQLLDSSNRRETKVDQVLNSSHRQEQNQQVIKAMLTQEFNYTMLSNDNRVLKIGWTKPSAKSDKSKDAVDIKADVIESLKKRYGRRHQQGDSFRYIDIQEGNWQHEQDTHDFLEREGVQVLYGNEYYPSHQAIEALRRWRVWCLGEFSMQGGILPPITDTPPEPEQGELNL